jgi:preprotein translocase SecE subunit
VAGEVNQEGNRSNPGAGGGDASRNGQNQTAVAQLVEQRIPNPQVAGSSPSRRVSDAPSHYSFGIYKYGQGYWVRMMTAVMAGILFLSAAGWMWGQLSAWANIPTPRWSFDVTGLEGAAAPGDTVTLLEAGGAGQPLGTGVVESFNTSGRNARVVVGTLQLGTKSPLDAKQLEVRRTDGTRAFAASVSRADGIRLFKLVYLQAAVAGVIVLAGGALTYYLVGRKVGSVEFLIATDAEMRKVNWSTRKVILDSTYVVIGATFLIAAIIFGADTMFAQLFRALGILGTG